MLLVRSLDPISVPPTLHGLLAHKFMSLTCGLKPKVRPNYIFVLCLSLFFSFNLRPLTGLPADEAPFSHSLGAHPGDDPAALEYLMGKLVRLEFDSTHPAALESAHAAHSQFPGWCHYMPLRPAELARLIQFQESLTRLGRYETIPNLRHLAWERCNCHVRSPFRVEPIRAAEESFRRQIPVLPLDWLSHN